MEDRTLDLMSATLPVPARGHGVIYTHLLPYNHRCVSGPTVCFIFSCIWYHSMSLTACCVHSPRCVLTPFNVLISVGGVVSCVKSSLRSPRSAQSCDEILGTPDNYEASLVFLVPGFSGKQHCASHYCEVNRCLSWFRP